MVVQPPPQVSLLETLARSKDPNARITSLEEVINCVSRSIEATVKELEDLTSWPLHRGEVELKDRRKSIHAEKATVDGQDDRNSVLGDHQTLPRSRWDALHWESCREEIQKPQPYGKDHYEPYYPQNCHSRSHPKQPPHNWPTPTGSQGLPQRMRP
jgi:hypothetical protein